MGKVNTIKTLSGVEMPQIIYGTAWKEERTTNLVMQAVTAGFNGIDTACQPRHYREDLVGDAISQLNQLNGVTRESLYIQTKFSPLGAHDPGNVPYDPNASLKDQVKQSFAKSQENLKTSYVDSLVLHSPLSTLDSLMEVWGAMEKIYNEGGCRQIGISNCYELEVMKQLWANANVKPAVLQNRLYSETGYDKDLRVWCKEQGVRYQSFWTLTANPHILGHSSMKQIATKHNKSEAQIFFCFLTQREITPLTGTCSNVHMNEDLEIFKFSLEEEELNCIEELL